MFPLVALSLLAPSPVSVSLPAVAYIRADPDGIGTGVVIDRERRWLVTCRHVVGDRKSAEVFFPQFRNGEPITDRDEYLSHRDRLRRSGLLVKGRVLRTSDELDLALLELDTLPPGRPTVPIADSRVSAGSRVVAVGHREDLPTLWNVSPGVVRQTGKLTDGYDWQGTLLAKDAPAALLQLPVEPGDSGGPVLNARGELVAVVSGMRRAATPAAIGIRADAVQAFILGRVTGSLRKSDPNPISLRAGHPGAVVWVCPTATDIRTAGVVIDSQRRLVLTSAAGVGPLDRVGVAFPLIKKGECVGDRDAYRDPVSVHLAKCWHVGTVLHRDPARDLSLLQLDSMPEGTPAVSLADADPVVGDAVTSVSHPTGTEFAFAVGTGSVKQFGRFALGRNERKVLAVVYQLPAQSTASGGPIFDAAGELVGVLSAKDAPLLTGYAVRVNEVRAFLGEAHFAAAGKTAIGVWGEVNTPRKLVAWHAFAGGRIDTALSLHPECVPALLKLGRFDRVLELAPQHRDALVGRAEIWLTKAEPKKAAADLVRVLDVTPADVVARRRFAFATATAGDEAKAAAEFVNVLRLDLSQLPVVKADLFTHADTLEKKAETRAADWLTLAFTTVNAVAKDDAIAAALRRAEGVSGAKEKLAVFRAVRP